MQSVPNKVVSSGVFPIFSKTVPLRTHATLFFQVMVARALPSNPFLGYPNLGPSSGSTSPLFIIFSCVMLA